MPPTTPMTVRVSLKIFLTFCTFSDLRRGFRMASRLSCTVSALRSGSYLPLDKSASSFILFSISLHASAILSFPSPSAPAGTLLGRTSCMAIPGFARCCAGDNPVASLGRSAEGPVKCPAAGLLEWRRGRHHCSAFSSQKIVYPSIGSRCPI